MKAYHYKLQRVSHPHLIIECFQCALKWSENIYYCDPRVFELKGIIDSSMRKKGNICAKLQLFTFQQQVSEIDTNM